MNQLGYSLILTNENGDSIDLYDDPGMAITSTDGFGINAEVTTQANGSSDGAYYVNATIPVRDISITVQYFSDTGDSELDKLRLINVCKIRQRIKLHYISPHKNCYIYGYIKSVDTPENSYPMTSQINLICPDPYWISDEDETVVDIQNGEATIKYDGDVPTGFVTTIHFSAAYRGVRITVNDKYFESDDNYASKYHTTGGFAVSSAVVINSCHGEKQIRYYANGDTNGDYKDYFLTTRVGLLYPQLVKGTNKIKIEGISTDGALSTANLTATIAYKNKYAGG